MTATTAAIGPRLAAPRMAALLTPFRIGVALALLALATRLIDLGTRPLWLDEAYSAWFAARPWHELWAVVPTYEPHPPFYYSLLKLWRGLFGGEAFALRFFSLLFAAATVPVVVAAAADLDRQRPSGRPLLAASVSGFLAACSPVLVYLGEEARPYPLLVFAYALAVLSMLRLVASFERGEAGAWRWWALLAAATELTLWAHGIGALYGACIALALLPSWIGRPVSSARIVRGLACAVTVAIAYAPCLAMMIGRTGDWGAGWLRWHPVMLFQLLTLYSVPAEMLTAGSAIAALTMLLLTKRALHAAFVTRGWTADKALVALWWGPTLIAVVVSIAVVPIFLPRALAGTLVPAYLAMGAALARSESQRERLLLGIALAVTLLPTAVQVALRQPAEEWRQVGNFLVRKVRAGDQVWLYPNDSALPLGEAVSASLLQARGIPGDYPATAFKGPIRAGSPAVVSVTHAQARKIASDPRLAAAPTIWLVTRQSELFDPQGEMPAALAAVRTPGRASNWGYIQVRPYARTAPRRSN